MTDSSSPLHAQWVAWDGSTSEDFVLRWDNGGWVAEGTVSGPDIQYAMRLGPDFSTRQFLLFRDLDDPDLWLAADGSGRWGEINGAERPDLRGCTSVSVTCSPSGALLGVRALDLEIGGNDSLLCATVDVETLEVVALEQRYTRLTERHWRLEVAATGFVAEFDTDEHGLVSSAPGWFSRIAPTS